MSKKVKLDQISSLTDLKNICCDSFYPNSKQYQKIAQLAAISLGCLETKPTAIEAIRTLQMCAIDDNSEVGAIDEVNYYINGGK